MTVDLHTLEVGDRVRLASGYEHQVTDLLKQADHVFVVFDWEAVLRGETYSYDGRWWNEPNSRDIVEIIHKPSNVAESDKVSAPSHYTRGKIEVMDFIQDQGLDFPLGSAIKYICRAGHKPGESFEDDIRKAQKMLEFALRA